MSQFEYVLFLRKGAAVRINNCGTSDVIQVKNPKNKVHPSEKPVDLIETIISNSSSVGDIVFDPFMGSGSTGVAAKNLNRKFIGIEIDESYFDIGKDRIEAA
jgi:site-specific DNA-methyltransferase (adenine-specific)